MDKNDFPDNNEEKNENLSVDASRSHPEAPPQNKENAKEVNSGAEDAAPLESLLYDSDDQPYAQETPEESAKFEAFLNEYKTLISNNLSLAKAIKREGNKEQSNSKSTPRSVKRKDSSVRTNAHTANRIDDWDDEITLLPETYESLDEDDKIFRDTPLPEEEPESDGFSIGTESYRSEDGDFQLSIKFDEYTDEKVGGARSEEQRKYDPNHPRFIDNIFDFVELFVITLVCVMILTTFIFKHSIVEGRSMQNTLYEGDSLIITGLFYTPERYDIVVFEDYSSSLKKAVVKRVIGLPGEKVEVKLDKNGFFEVYINDELLPEEYAFNDPDTTPPPTGIWYIGENEVFVMGDNRYNSTDSRDKAVGPINIDCILGKVVLRFYPFDRFGTVD